MINEHQFLFNSADLWIYIVAHIRIKVLFIDVTLLCTAMNNYYNTKLKQTLLEFSSLPWHEIIWHGNRNWVLLSPSCFKRRDHCNHLNRPSIPKRKSHNFQFKTNLLKILKSEFTYHPQSFHFAVEPKNCFFKSFFPSCSGQHWWRKTSVFALPRWTSVHSISQRVSRRLYV